MRCDGSLVSPHWRVAYAWMKQRYRELVGCDEDYELLWLWMVPTDRPAREAEYRALSSLCPGFNDARQMSIIELTLPEDLVLTSSYSRWNVLLDYCIVNRRTPERTEDWLGMFDCKSLEKWDKIQGVVPWIERSWIDEVLEVDAGLFRKYGATVRL